jgi:hypothetical protein
MSDKRIYKLVHDTARRLAAAQCMTAPDGYVVRIEPATRSLDQNSLLWPLLTELSNQVDWYGNKLTPDEWKDVMTAGLKRNRIVPGIDGGFVVLGMSTSKMDKRTFSELIDLIHAFGAQHGVVFHDERREA